MRAGRGRLEGEGERESQADSKLSTEPKSRRRSKVPGPLTRDSVGHLISCPFLSGESPTYNRFSSDPGSGHLSTWRTDEGTGQDPQGPMGSWATGYCQANETANSNVPDLQ